MLLLVLPILHAERRFIEEPFERGAELFRLRVPRPPSLWD